MYRRLIVLLLALVLALSLPVVSSAATASFSPSIMRGSVVTIDADAGEYGIMVPLSAYAESRGEDFANRWAERFERLHRDMTDPSKLFWFSFGPAVVAMSIFILFGPVIWIRYLVPLILTVRGLVFRQRIRTRMALVLE